MDPNAPASSPPPSTPAGPRTAPRSLTPDEKSIVVGALVTAVLCFLPWYAVSFDSAEMGEMMRNLGGSTGASKNALGFTWGVFVFLLALATAAVPFAVSQGLLTLQPNMAMMLPLATSAGAAIAALIFLGGGGVESVSAPGISAGRTFWFYCAAISIGYTVFRAFKRWQASRVAAPI